MSKKKTYLPTTNILGICQKMFKSKNVIVIYWASNKLKQLNIINSQNNKNGLLCLATACILAAIVYVFLTVIWYLKNYKALCLSFIDNRNNDIIYLVITNAVSLELQWHKPDMIC